MAEDDFTLGDAISIAHKCTVEIAGRDHDLEPSSTLEAYGIKTGEQESLVKKDVRTNGQIGLPAFNRTISPNALKDLTKKWTITKLSDIIFDFSHPTGEETLAAAASAGSPSGAGRSAPPQRPARSAGTLTVMISAAAGFLMGFMLGQRIGKDK